MKIIEEVIERVEKLDGDEGRPIVGYEYPLFEWAPDIEINETLENDEE